MIQTRINNEDIPWGEPPPFLAYNPVLDIIIIVSGNNDFFKGTVVFSNNPSHPIGEYYQYWDKSYFSAFEGVIILNNKR